MRSIGEGEGFSAACLCWQALTKFHDRLDLFEAVATDQAVPDIAAE